MPFHFRRPVPDDAVMILDWRTRPDVTRYMYTDIETPDVDRQRAWLAAMNERADYRQFVIEAEGRPIGYLSYSEIDRVHRRCSSGLYVAEAADRKRFAGFLSPFIFDYCFYALDMNKLVNTYMEGNERLVRIQRLVGYREVGVLRQHVWKYGRWHDVLMLELLRETYEQKPRTFPLNTTLAAFDPAG